MEGTKEKIKGVAFRGDGGRVEGDLKLDYSKWIFIIWEFFLSDE